MSEDKSKSNLTSASVGAVGDNVTVSGDTFVPLQPTAPALMQILAEVQQERKSQDAKWGEQNHSFHGWIGVLTEEVGEAAQAANRAMWEWPEVPHRRAMRAELIQVAAVAIAAVECLDRKAWKK